MTDNAKLKKAVRARMANTGEKYTEARRALPQAGRPNGAAANGATPGPEVPPPTWALMRQLLDQSTRSPAWRETAQWAFDVLEEELGSSWPVDAVTQFGELPIPVILASGHALAFIQTVGLAMRLRLLRSADGMARIRKELRGNRDLGRVLHSSLQATIGGLALRLGWPLQLESGDPPADLWFQANGHRTTAEMKVLRPSGQATDRQKAVDYAMRQIRDRATSFGLWPSGRMSAVPSETALGDVLDWISRSAGFVQGRGIAQPYRQPGFDLTLTRSDDPARAAFHGPIGGENLLPRFMRTLNEKVDRMEKSGAEWLCVENLTGLFGFTGWGRMALPHKVASLDVMARDRLADASIGGVVVCSGVGHFNGTVPEEVAEHPSGSIGLRCAITPLRAREVIVIPVSQSARPAASEWRTLFESERDWFAWALNALGLPTFDDIMAT